MLNRTAYRHFQTALIAALFALVFTVQSFALAHSTQYSDDGHEHDGVACDVMHTAAQQAAILPPPAPVQGFTAPLITTIHVPFTSASYITPQGRAPPPRSPPLPI